MFGVWNVSSVDGKVEDDGEGVGQAGRRKCVPGQGLSRDLTSEIVDRSMRELSGGVIDVVFV